MLSPPRLVTLCRCGSRLSPHLHDRSDFDRAHARRWNPGGNVNSLVETPGVDQVVAAELLACLRERTVGDEPLAVAHPHAGRRRRRLQLGTGKILTSRPDLLAELPVFAVNLLPLRLAQLPPRLLVVVNQQHVLHVCASVSESNGDAPDRQPCKKESTIARAPPRRRPVRSPERLALQRRPVRGRCRCRVS